MEQHLKGNRETMDVKSSYQVKPKLRPKEIEISDLHHADDLTKTIVTTTKSSMSSDAFDAATCKNTSLSHDTIQVHTTQCKDNGVTVSQNNRRKMANFKDIPLAVRQFKAATPYRKPTFVDTSEKSNCHDKMNSSLSAVDCVTFAKSIETTTKPFRDTLPNQAKTANTYALVNAREKRNPPTRFPVPFRKVSECQELRRSDVPESLKSVENDGMKAVSSSKTPITSERKRSPASLSIERRIAKVETERYYTHVQNVYTNMSRENDIENRKADDENVVQDVRKESRNISKENDRENKKAVDENEVVHASSGHDEVDTNELPSEEPLQIKVPVESEVVHASSRHDQVDTNELSAEEPFQTEGLVESEASWSGTDIDMYVIDSEVSSSDSGQYQSSTSSNHENDVSMSRDIQSEDSGSNFISHMVVWLFRFLRRYFFLTLIIIRYSH